MELKYKKNPKKMLGNMNMGQTKKPFEPINIL